MALSTLSNAGCFKISGTEFKPTRLNIIYDTLASEDSGRTDDGVMHINWIIGKGQPIESIVRLEIEMPPCSAAKAQQILSLVQGNIYYITYYDIRTDSEKTVKVYTSTSQGNCYSGVFNSSTGLWEGISFNAISTGD